MIQDRNIRNKGNPKIFCNKRGNGVFIRGFTDDIRMECLVSISPAGKASKTGSTIISDERVMFQIMDGYLLFFRKRVANRGDDAHFLVQDRDELDVWFIFYIRSENDIILFIF